MTRASLSLRLASLAFAVALSPSAFAFQTAHDSWGGADKAKHFAVSAIAGGAGAYVAREAFGARENAVLAGAALGVLPGLARELWQAQGSGRGGFSSRDMAFNALGALAGAYVGNRWMISPMISRDGRVNGAMVSYQATLD